MPSNANAVNGRVNVNERYCIVRDFNSKTIYPNIKKVNRKFVSAC